MYVFKVTEQISFSSPFMPFYFASLDVFRNEVSGKGRTEIGMVCWLQSTFTFSLSALHVKSQPLSSVENPQFEMIVLTSLSDWIKQINRCHCTVWNKRKPLFGSSMSFGCFNFCTFPEVKQMLKLNCMLAHVTYQVKSEYTFVPQVLPPSIDVCSKLPVEYIWNILVYFYPCQRKAGKPLMLELSTAVWTVLSFLQQWDLRGRPSSWKCSCKLSTNKF